MVGKWVDLLVLKSVCCDEFFWMDVIFLSEFEEGEGVFVAVNP